MELNQMVESTTMSVKFISVKEASETYGYSESHIRNLLAKGLIAGDKFTSVWMVDPKSVQEYKAQMEKLGRKKHGTWVQNSACGV